MKILLKLSIILLFIFFSSSSLYAQLYWETFIKYNKKDINHPRPYYQYFLTQLSYKEKNEVKWKVNLPSRMRNYVAEHLTEKIDINKFTTPPFLRGGILYLENAIAISDKSGFLILNKNNGKIILDIAYDQTKDIFLFDRGEYTIQIGDKKCKERTYKRHYFIAECDNYIINFGSSNLMILDKNNFKLLKEIIIDPKKHIIPDKKKFPFIFAEIEYDIFKIILEGRIFLK